ncbi:MAG: TraB/GumN family protein [Treponema sp.]|jgi:pheromone shutdown protein TraB|nr:TraB/GumN family protein [Treponema sp.]
MNESNDNGNAAGTGESRRGGGNSVTLNLKGREITLIGTAHVSRESIGEVSRVIRETRPGVVCVELDQGRYNSISQKENWERLDVVRIFKDGKGFLLIANLVLSGFQRRLGNELGVKPGEEMKTAVETAAELGIPYALCDREVQITLRRAWAHCGLWSKCKLLASLLSSAFTTEKLSEAEIENLKNHSELDGMMSELAGYLPGVKETLIDERDRYLAAKIWTAGEPPPGSGSPLSTASTAEAADSTDAALPEGAPAALSADSAKRKTAVVGAGHIPGLRAHLEKIAAGEESAETEDLDRIPPAGLLSKAAGWIIPVLLAALIALGFFRSGAGVSFAMLRNWLLWNGSLAALGALLALGHPLSILVSFLGAPIATLNPFIGVGLFSGVTEAWLRKPRVSDTETISEDVTSLRGIYRNRISKALLVFFLSTLGGAIGNFISIPSLAGLLAK